MIAVTWNVENGKATKAAVELADRLEADVLLLQEAGRIAEWNGDQCSASVPGGKWGSSILVRDGSLDPILVAGFEGWVVAAMWRRPGFDDTFLVSLHSPTSRRSEPREGYVQESRKILRAICEEADELADAPLIIGGDFNFLSLGERLTDEDLSTTPEERAALREFGDQRLALAWPHLNPDRPLPQTLRWKRDPRKPYHCDGFLIRDVDLSGGRCEVLPSDAIVLKSDHNPVVLRLLGCRRAWPRH